MADFIEIQTNMETVEAILDLLDIAGVSPSHPDLITSSDIIQAVVIIRDRLENPPEMALAAVAAQTAEYDDLFGAFPSAEGEGLLSSLLDDEEEDPDAPYYSNKRQVPEHKRILILSHLGIVTYQLKRILASRGLEVHIAKDTQEALFEFNRRPYGGVIIDLFIPKAEQGLTALASMRKAAEEKHKVIDIVMLASPQGDGEDDDQNIDYRPIVMKSGAQAFVIKRSDWYDEVLHFFTRPI